MSEIRALKDRVSTEARRLERCERVLVTVFKDIDTCRRAVLPIVRDTAAPEPGQALVSLGGVIDAAATMITRLVEAQRALSNYSQRL